MKARDVNGQIELQFSREELPMVRAALNGKNGHAKEVREQVEPAPEVWLEVPDNFMTMIRELDAKRAKAAELRESQEHEDNVATTLTTLDERVGAMELREAADNDSLTRQVCDLAGAVKTLAELQAKVMAELIKIAGRPVLLQMPKIVRETETTLLFDGDGEIKGKKERTTEKPA